MKKVKKTKKYEPTIADVLDAVQTGFERHEDILNRHEKILGTLHVGQQNLQELLSDRTNGLGQRVSSLQNRIEDIAEMLEDVTDSGHKTRVSVLDHEQRIRRLEKART